jgi:hypothetical protein
MLRKYIQDVALLFDFQDTLPVRKFAAASSTSVLVAVRAAPLCRRHACLYSKSPFGPFAITSQMSMPIAA